MAYCSSINPVSLVLNAGTPSLLIAEIKREGCLKLFSRFSEFAQWDRICRIGIIQLYRAGSREIHSVRLFTVYSIRVYETVE